MAKGAIRDLLTVIDFRISQLLQLDLGIGVLGGIGGISVALLNPEAIQPALPVAAGLLGVVIGAVVAGAALQSAFLDQPFLRKIRAIGRDPVRYLTPFLFTGALGVLASLSLITMSVTGPQTSLRLLVPLTGLSALLTCWTIASLLPCLSTVVQFIRLKVDALDVPDDIDDGHSNPNSKGP